MGKEKVGMTLFFNWERPLSRLPAEDFKTIVMGVMAYEARGEALPSPESFENELSGIAADFIFPLVERGWEKSKECSEAGKKGMNSRWHTEKAEDSETEEVSEAICEGDNGVICEGDNEVIREADNGVIRREDNNRKEKNINRTEIETDKGTKRISENPPSNSPKGEGARAPAQGE